MGEMGLERRHRGTRQAFTLRKHLVITHILKSVGRALRARLVLGLDLSFHNHRFSIGAQRSAGPTEFLRNSIAECG
jgi:hypothetical protein